MSGSPTIGEHTRHACGFPRPRGKHGRTEMVQVFVSTPPALLRNARRSASPEGGCAPRPVLSVFMCRWLCGFQYYQQVLKKSNKSMLF